MRIEPINSSTERAAKVALEQMKQYYDALAEKALVRANYLKELGANLSQLEEEQAKNAAMFAKIREQAAAQHAALREYVSRQQRLSQG